MRHLRRAFQRFCASSHPSYKRYMLENLAFFHNSSKTPDDADIANRKHYSAPAGALTMFFGICRLNISRYHAWMLWEWFQILAWFIWFCFWFGVWNVFYFSEQKIDDSASISFPILLGSLNLNQKSWNDVIPTCFGGLIRLDTRKCMLFFWYPVNTGKIVQGLCCHSWWFYQKPRLLGTFELVNMSGAHRNYAVWCHAFIQPLQTSEKNIVHQLIRGCPRKLVNG